jgi:RNA polymerase sigma-70 factor (ECF subfamily)
MADQAAGWPEAAAPAKNRSKVLQGHPADLSVLSDVDLMELLKEGENDALSVLFDRYYRLVLNVATKILRDRSEAEDVMQEVFLEVFRNADRFDAARGTPKAWIATLAYHKSLNRRKYLVLRSAFEDRQIDEFDPTSVTDSFFCRAGYRSQGDEDVLAIVQQGLTTLNPKQREVVQLVCFEGYLLSEIAERTKETLGNVRHHYYRGISKLREFVKDKESERETQKAKWGSARGGWAAFSGGGR